MLLNSYFIEETKMHKTETIRNFDLDTKTGKVFNALVRKGEVLSAADISKRFGVKNPTATISNIRQRGYAIYANTRKAGNGVMVTEYKHGNASRKLVALAYRAQSLGITV